MKNLIKKLLRENLNDADIQLYIDIIDGMEKSNPKREKYIQILKNKYGYEYVEGDDKDFIEDANIKDIKKLSDFRNYNSYKKYAEKLLRIREQNIDYDNFFNVLNGSSIDKENLVKLLTKYKVKSVFDGTSHWSKPSGDNTIHWSKGDSFDKSHVLHELAHLIQDNFGIPITYSLTDYGLGGGETVAEDVMLYLLNPNYFKKILPDVGQHIESNIPNWIIKLRNELVKI